MSGAAIVPFRRRGAALALAAVLLLAGLFTLFAMSLASPAAGADGPVLTISSGTTNPGGTVMITGTGWSPAQHYTLYVYGQAACGGQPTCPPPAGKKPIATGIPINNDGTLREFDFTFIKTAGITTYVFTVVADAPAANPYTASVLLQIVPAGTPPSGTPVSSAPTTAPTTNPTTAPASPTAKKTQSGGTTTGNNQTPTTSSSGGGSTTALIVVVLILLLLMIGVLVALLRILPPKRRAIRAQYYGSGPAAAPGRVTGGYRRQSSGAYPPTRDDDLPWQGGVASWGDDEPRAPRATRPPRRPTSRDSY